MLRERRPPLPLAAGALPELTAEGLACLETFAMFGLQQVSYETALGRSVAAGLLSKIAWQASTYADAARAVPRDGRDPAWDRPLLNFLNVARPLYRALAFAHLAEAEMAESAYGRASFRASQALKDLDVVDELLKNAPVRDLERVVARRVPVREAMEKTVKSNREVYFSPLPESLPDPVGVVVRAAQSVAPPPAAFRAAELMRSLETLAQ